LDAALWSAIRPARFRTSIGPAARSYIQPDLERDRHWQALGFFDLKEDFVAIGLGLLPAYWISWRRPLADERGRTASSLTTILGFIVWWSFLVGHIVNDIMGFGS
jgi:hypothetical protein